MADPMAVSIKPSEMVDASLVPDGINVTWKECRFNLFNYTKKDGTIVATTVAAKINYVGDDGTVYEVQYSVGDKERFAPSADGKTLMALVPGAALSKSSNFSLLMNALVNSGLPENKLTGDISILDGLYTHNIGMPEPKRSGLKKNVTEGAEDRVRLVSIPDSVITLPWEKKGAKGAKSTSGNEKEVAEAAVKFVGGVLESAEGDSVTRQELATAVFTKLAKDPNKDAIAGLIFTDAFKGTLMGNGYAIDGENISKA